MQTFRSIQLWATITALSLAPLFFGSVDRFWIAIWTVVLSISVMCGAVARRMGASQRRVVYVFVAVCSVYAIVAAIQVAPDSITKLSDPIWQRASKLLDTNSALANFEPRGNPAGRNWAFCTCRHCFYERVFSWNLASR